MANEKVSQMTQLSAAEVASDDLLLITDISARESKRITTSDFLKYIESTGSFNVYHSSLADSASYVLGSNVNGIVKSSSYSLNSDTSSYSFKSILSDTASYSKAASFSLNIISSGATLVTGSTYPITSSWSLISNNAKTASFLQYINGISNGTASYALSSSVSNTSSFSITSSFILTSSYSATSSYSLISKNSDSTSFIDPSIVYAGGPIKAWTYVSWSVGVAFPQIMTNYNISSIKWLSRFAGASTYYWDQFGVTFQTPLENSNYILIGNGYQPYADPYPFYLVLHPVYSNKTISSFTMSIATTNAVDVYISVPSSYPNDQYGYVMFQILGL